MSGKTVREDRNSREQLRNKQPRNSETEEQPSVVLKRFQTFKHESLILAQDERWRRA